MAQFPCDIDGLPYRGPQRTAYPAVVFGGDATRMKRRLCPKCFAALHEWCTERLQAPGISQLVVGCAVCDSEAAEGAVFVTAYDAGSDREDFYGRVCRGHCADVTELFLFGEQGRLAGV